MTDQMIPADAIRAWRKKFEGCTGNTGLEALDDLLASATEDTAPEKGGEFLGTDPHPDDVALARDFADEYRDSEYAPDRTLAVARVLQALLPPPPLPTLADMAPRERAACKWMQADIIGGDEPLVITRIDRTDGTALILDRNGRLDGVPAGHVTPRPDLPRMTWPGDKNPAPALPDGFRVADHAHFGRVITSPRPDDQGLFTIFARSEGSSAGVARGFATAEVLTFLDTDTDNDTITHQEEA